MSHVPDVAVAAATGHNSTRAAASGVRQSTNEVFMVAPTAFGFNDQARAGQPQHSCSRQLMHLARLGQAMWTNDPGCLLYV